MDEILRGMKSVSDEIGGALFSGKLYVLWKWIMENPGVLPHILLSLILAGVLFALIIGVVFGAHLMVNLVRKRRAQVFISFQHEREPIADVLAFQMADSGISQEKLPFSDNPDHNALLDQVKQAIRKCDVFVCVPGNRPSFVESEVAMAFGLDKPLLFVLNEQDKPRLPNTAKTGYPVFSLERLQCEGFQSLVRLCSYLAGDYRSTIRLYAAVFEHLIVCALFAVAISLVSMVFVQWIVGVPKNVDLIDASVPIPVFVKSVLSEVFFLSLMGSCLVLFLFTYGLFFLRRFVLRTKTGNFQQNVQPKLSSGVSQLLA
jgi:hypothetical protein